MDIKKFRVLTPEEVRGILEEADLLWLYKGEPRPEAPHVLLTAGNHSDGFAMVGKILKEQPEVRNKFAESLLGLLEQTMRVKFTRITGAATSSTALVAEMASICGAKPIEMIKVEDKEGKRQVWHPDNEPLQDGEWILHAEELLTSAFSALEVRKGIRKANPGIRINYVPFLTVIVERSNPDDRVIWVEESKVLPNLQLKIYNYEPDREHCRYCFVGSEAIKAKEGDNWLRLHGKI